MKRFRKTFLLCLLLCTAISIFSNLHNLEFKKYLSDDDAHKANYDTEICSDKVKKDIIYNKYKTFFCHDPIYNIYIEKLSANHVYDTKENLSFCLPKKTGSTSFRLMLGGEKSMFHFQNSNQSFIKGFKKSLHSSLNFGVYSIARYTNYSENFVKSCKSILVRHPLKRLLSGFKNKFLKKNKLVDSNKQYFDFVYPKLSFASYSKMLRNNETDFKSFIQYIIDFSHKNGPQNLNTHYIPIYLDCELCQINYNYIIKFENYENDAKLFKDIYLPRKYSFPHLTTTDDNISLIHTLSSKQRDDIYNIFKPDYVLFNYTKLP